MRLGPLRRVDWPRRPPPLSEAQKQAREQFMQLWEQQLPSRYKAIEQFNHGWVARLPHPPGCRTLEIGAGLGSHMKYENLADQDYHVLEMRAAFCDQMKRTLDPSHVHCADIQQNTGFPDRTWDRMVAIHMLEHLPDLPAALREIKRILKPGGFFDVVIPCDGGWAHTLARRISAQRLFESTFHMSFAPITQNEHVSHFPEIITLLQEVFQLDTYSFFPLFVPVYQINLVTGLRLRVPDENTSRRRTS